MRGPTEKGIERERWRRDGGNWGNVEERSMIGKLWKNNGGVLTKFIFCLCSMIELITPLLIQNHQHCLSAEREEGRETYKTTSTVCLQREKKGEREGEGEREREDE